MIEMDFAFYSDVGGRDNNEDSYLAKQTAEWSVFAVADGLGGHGDGELASRAAVDVLKEQLLLGSDMAGAVSAANAMVRDMQAASGSRMKTTLAAAYVSGGEAVLVHVGDSRIYAFKNGRIVFQSRDHSASQMAVAVGEISPSEIRGHSDRNVLTRALGGADEVKPDITRLPAGDYDALLLCSDGFWEYVYEEEMLAALADSRSADIWLYKMRAIQLRRAPDGCDNNTAVAVMI